MTPKEKAIELVQSFYEVNPENGHEYGMEWQMAKQCALIAVDEILGKRLSPHLGWAELEYWQQVKTKIQNL